MRLYRTTKAGRKVAGDISRHGDDVEVLRAMSDGPMEISDISASSGLPKGKVGSIVGSLVSQHLAKEITGSGAEEGF